MTSADLKKLIAIFLLAASAVSSIAIVTPAFLSRRPAVSPEAGPGTQSPASRNAFVELPSSTVPAPTTPDVLPPPASPDNLTENLARTIAQEILNKNPEGPTVVGDQISAAPPDVSTVIDQFTNDPEIIAQVRSLYLKDTPEEKGGRVIDAYSRRDITNYFHAVDRVFTTKLLNSGFLGLFGKEPSLEGVNAAQVVLQDALQDLEALRVPQPLESFHRAVLRVLTHGESLTSFSVESNDPLKELVAFELRAQGTDEAVRNLEQEIRRLSSIRVSALDPGSGVSLLGAIFGVKRADAQVPLAVPILDLTPTTIAGHAAQVAEASLTFKEWLIRLGTEFLKDRLIHAIVKQVIVWIQGGGKPKFVTDWKGFLLDAADKAVGNAIARWKPRLCQSFGPLVTVLLNPVNPENDAPITCTLDQVVGNVQAFYDNFQNGGWVAYASTLEPQNNVFGAIYLTNLLASEEKRKAEEAARNDALAGQGFFSEKICLKYEERCKVPVPFGNIDLCLPADRYQECVQEGNTTPGAAIGNVLFKALPSPIERIVNAQDLTALANAVVNWTLTKLIGLGEKGLLGLVFDKDACDGLTGDAYVQCLVEQGCKDAGLSGKDLQDCILNKPPSSGGGACGDKLPEAECWREPAQICPGDEPNSCVDYKRDPGPGHWANGLFNGFYDIFEGANGERYLFYPGGKFVGAGGTSPTDPTTWSWVIAPRTTNQWCAVEERPLTSVRAPTTNLRAIFGPIASGGRYCPAGRVEYRPVDAACREKISDYYACLADLTPTGPPGGGGGGSGECDPNCTCEPPPDAFRYSGNVRDAINTAKQFPEGNGLDPNDPDRILDFDKYHLGVVCTLRSRGFVARHDSEEIGIYRPGDTFQEQMDISTAQGRIYGPNVNGICRAPAYPDFTNSDPPLKDKSFTCP